MRGTPPSARGGRNTRVVSCKHTCFRETIEIIRAHVHVAFVFSASIYESGQVPDEKVVNLVFAV